jgi:hypothetical protein
MGSVMVSYLFIKGIIRVSGEGVKWISPVIVYSIIFFTVVLWRST